MFLPLRPLALALLAAAVVSGCAPSNRLREATLDGRRVAITAAIPPHPRVQPGSPAEAAINPYDPIGSSIRLGTAGEKAREMRRAQARLDSAIATVDVADRIARQVLVRSAAALGFTPADRPAAADYVIDLRVRDYSLVSDSFEGRTFFVLEGEVLFLDARTGRTLWRRPLRERELLDASLFGFGVAAGNVVTARALAGLSEAEMATGLRRLADFAAERIVTRLRQDYARSR